MLCIRVVVYRRFGGTYCLYLHALYAASSLLVAGLVYCPTLKMTALRTFILSALSWLSVRARKTVEGNCPPPPWGGAIYKLFFLRFCILLSGNQFLVDLLPVSWRYIFAVIETCLAWMQTQLLVCLIWSYWTGDYLTLCLLAYSWPLKMEAVRSCPIRSYRTSPYSKNKQNCCMHYCSSDGFCHTVWECRVIVTSRKLIYFWLWWTRAGEFPLAWGCISACATTSI
jgi:hypothetical protein